MKTIEYDPNDYEVISTIDFDDTKFQKVKFKSGHYGVVFITCDNYRKYYDVIFVGTDKSDTYVNVFLEFARNQTDVINKIHENIDEVHLVVTLDNEQSEVFEQVVSKDEANDLIERLKIANEIVQMKEEDNSDLIWLLIACFILNIAFALLNLKGVLGL
jgi:hypothetical protein